MSEDKHPIQMVWLGQAATQVRNTVQALRIFPNQARRQALGEGLGLDQREKQQVDLRTVLGLLQQPRHTI
eukprot:15218336-Alexandrium_andersonii.AAC.1